MFNPDTWTIIALMVGLFFFIWKTNRDLRRKFESKTNELSERLAVVENHLTDAETRLDTLSDSFTSKSQPK